MQVKRKENKEKSRHNYCSVRTNGCQISKTSVKTLRKEKEKKAQIWATLGQMSPALSAAPICQSDFSKTFTPTHWSLDCHYLIHNTISKNHLPQWIQFGLTDVSPILSNSEKSNVQPLNWIRRSRYPFIRSKGSFVPEQSHQMFGDDHVPWQNSDDEGWRIICATQITDCYGGRL
jgi:hypothetical protein